MTRIDIEDILNRKFHFCAAFSSLFKDGPT